MENQSFLHRSDCPLASSLDFLGDKWSLLVVRDLLYYGQCTFKDFETSWEKMPTNTLADRLKRLEAIGVIEKTAYQEKPVRYRYGLTEKGLGLVPIIKEFVLWGQKYIPHTIERVKIVDGIPTLTHKISIDEETARAINNHE